MNRLWRFFLAFIFVLFVAQSSFAEDYKILVLPDNIQFDSTNYLIFPDSSTMFATDTINEFKKHGLIQTVSMTEVRDALRKNTKLAILTKNAMKEYKYNYNIPFVDFKAIANCFDTDKILIISSQTDTQNYFMQRTLWDFLNIPGATVINPTYKMSTYVSLIDVNKEEIVWQSTYYKKIGAFENRIIAQSFAPATQQLEKIKSYSMYFLAPVVASTVQAKIIPPAILAPDKNIITVSDKKQKNQQEMFPPLEPIVEKGNLPKQKIYVPFKTAPNDYGEIINDL